MDVCVCLFVFGHTVLYSMLHVPGVIKKILPLAYSTVQYCTQKFSCSAKQIIAILSINNRLSRLSRVISSFEVNYYSTVRHVPYSSRYLEIGTRAGIAYSRAVLYVIYMYIYYMYRYLLGWTSVHGRITSVILSIINFKGVVNHCFLC